VTPVRLVIDPERCCGQGRCFDIVPELVEPDELGYAAAIEEGGITPELEPRARQAVANCPERALSIVTITAGPATT
jgi:ferredoxin